MLHNVSDDMVDPIAAHMVTSEFANQHTLIPVTRADNKLRVAMSEPLNLVVREQIEIRTGYKIVPLAATSNAIRQAVRYHFNVQNATRQAIASMWLKQDADELNRAEPADKSSQVSDDPVEYRLDGATQVQVKPAVGRTFACTLRSILRQDPDIILIGEIRDEETAEFKNVGIRLDVEATLTDNNDIFLTVDAEQNVATGQSDTEIPIVDTRKANTSLLLKDGQVVIFGGLRRQEKTKEVDQIPFIADLPFIGELFKSTKIVTKNSELIIFLSPHIYKGEPVPDDAMSKFKEIRDKPMLSSKNDREAITE